MTPPVGPRLVVRERDAFAPSAMLALVGTFCAICLVSLKAPALLVTALVLPWLVWGLWTRQRSGRGDVRVDGGDIVYDFNGRVERVALADVTSAWRSALFVPPDLGRAGNPMEAWTSWPIVALELRGRTHLRFSVRDDAEAEAFLRRIGKDPSNHRASFRGRRVFHSALAWMVGAPLAGTVTAVLMRSLPHGSWAHSPAVALAVFAAAFLGLRRILRPSLDLEVGSNGVLDRTRWRGRFLPWSRVASIEQGAGWVAFVLHDGTRRTVWCDPDDATVHPAVYARAREALDAWKRAASAADPLTALDRNGRSIAQWRADLATLLTSATGYREQTVDRARLEALAADPAAPLERRVGAALALAPVAPAGQPTTRVRVAPEASADPAERDLLRRMADGDLDDDAIEAALRRAGGA